MPKHSSRPDIEDITLGDFIKLVEAKDVATILELLQEDKEKWNSLITGFQKELGKRDNDKRLMIDLSNVNLSGKDLKGRILSKVDLSGADLSETDLSETDLSNSDLSRADITNSDLSDTNLYATDIYKAQISQTDMHGANTYAMKNIDKSYITGSVNLFNTAYQGSQEQKVELSTLEYSQPYENNPDMMGGEDYDTDDYDDDDHPAQINIEKNDNDKTDSSFSGPGSY